MSIYKKFMKVQQGDSQLVLVLL